MDSDSDNESDLRDLEQLNSVLESDKSHGEGSSQCSSGANQNLLPKDDISKIEMAIAVNKILDEKYRKLENLLKTRLNEVRQKLEELRNNDLEEKEKPPFAYCVCVRPYFKDKNGFTPPDNEDTKTMKRSQMLDFSRVCSLSGWTVKDKGMCMTKLRTMSIEIKKKEFNSQIAEIKRQKKLTKNQQRKKINLLLNEMKLLNNKPLRDIALPIDQDYDWYSLANKLNHRHSPHEYEAFWKLFLHPSINKSSWTKEEQSNLHTIASQYKYQDWDAIAKEMNTGRTGYQCFIYYRTNMQSSSHGDKWTTEEVEYLKRLIEFYREGNYLPWNKIVSHMENRTRIQIYSKYLRLREFRKGRFLPEEDALLLTCVDEFGPNFNKVSSYMPGRSKSQLRIRHQKLVTRRISCVWSEAEDKKLLQLMSSQDIYTYASIESHFPGKDRTHIRSRYVTLTRWMKVNPNLDIKYAPRRPARRLGHGVAQGNIKKAVDKLKSKIQSEVQDVRSKKITKDSPEEVIEDGIVAFLANEHFKNEMAANTSTSEVVSVDHNECNVENIRRLLILLKARLNVKKFEKEYSNHDKFKKLLDAPPAAVKSYSRKKNPEPSTSKSNQPDIWGNNMLENCVYYLPPNYNTISACRSLMAYLSKYREHNSFTLPYSAYVKKYPSFKENYEIFLRRFMFLFMWPMVLSQISPEDEENKDEEE